MINNENCFLSKSIEFSQSKDRKFDSRLKNSDSVYVVERDEQRAWFCQDMQVFCSEIRILAAIVIQSVGNI